MLSADTSTLLLVRVFIASLYVSPCNMHMAESGTAFSFADSGHFVATSHVAGIVLHHLLFAALWL